MKRKFLTFVLAMIFVSALLIPANATTYGGHIVDNAGLLTETEIQDLEYMAQEILDSFGMDAVVLTLDSLNGASPQDTADDFFDYNGYGEDGVLFLLAMEEREWYISTAGNAIYALTDYGIQQVGFVMLPYLSEGDYYGAFRTYFDELPVYFEALAGGAPIDGYADYSGDYYHGDQEEILYYEGEEEFEPSVFVSLILGLIVAGIAVLIMRSSMNTKRPQRSAAVYMQTGSYKLHTQQDRFLYSKVTKTRKPEPSSGSSGGGSSVHRSSSGRSHGGGGGKF